MRKSDRLAEKQSNLKNAACKEPNAQKRRLNSKTAKIPTMDNGTMVESFKYLNYYQLAKKSIVSKRFRNVIQTHRHSLPRLYVSSIVMERGNHTSKFIKMFNGMHSAEAYNEWVIDNHYSKQIPLERQIVEKESTQYNRVYELTAYSNFKDPSQSNALSARTQLNDENWPLFRHFVSLLSNHFVYIEAMKLVPQNDVLNLLIEAINPDRDRLRCEELKIDLYDDAQKLISWIKDHVCCDKFYICNVFYAADSIYDHELLTFFLTGARCTSAIDVTYYDISNVVVNFVKEFLDCKNCELVQSIKSETLVEDEESRVAQILKRDYPEFIVKEEHNEEYDIHKYVFAFNNDDIEKKLELIITFNNFDEYTFESNFSLNIEDL